MSAILPSIAAGASAGAVILFFSHVAPRFSAGNFIRDLDRPTLFGRMVTRREAHVVGILVHMVLSAVFAGVYGLAVDLGVAPGFDFFPMLVWGGMLAAVSGSVILPLEGHGFFGLKEDAWFPVDLVLTNVLWAVLFWWLMSLWMGLAL